MNRDVKCVFFFTLIMLVLQLTLNWCCCHTCRVALIYLFRAIAAHDAVARGLGGEAPVSTASKVLVRLREDTWGWRAPPNKKVPSAVNVRHTEKHFKGSA